MNTYVMEGEGEDRRRRLENTHDVTPGMWIATNPKQQESDYPNSYPIEDQKFHKLYEASGGDGVYKPKGLAKLIPNETGREVEIELPESWGGGLMSGAKDCFFRQPCDIDGNPTGRPSIIAADAVESTYGPIAEVRPDLFQHTQAEKDYIKNRDTLEIDMTLPNNGLILDPNQYDAPSQKENLSERFGPTAERFIRATVWGEKHIYDHTFNDAVQEELGSGTLNIPRENPEKTFDYFSKDVMNGLISIDEAAWFLECTNGIPHMDDESAKNAINQIDDLNSEAGKTNSDVQHERKIIGYLLDGSGEKRDVSNGFQNPDRWHHPERVDGNAIRTIVAKYNTILDFRVAEIQLIQNLGVGSEVHAENEAKREEYRRAGRELEKIIYGEKEVERANGIMDAFAEAGFTKNGPTKMFAKLPKDQKYCVADDSDYLVARHPAVRPLFEYDANLRVRPEYDSLKWHRENLLPNQ